MKPYYEDNRISIFQGSCLHLDIPDETIQCVVTSPPYFGLRKYEGEQEVPEFGCAFGLEPDPSMYVTHTVEILREIKRVLRKDGVCFLNLGDSYFARGGAHKPEHANPGLSKSASRGGVPHGGQNGKRGKVSSGSLVSDFFSQNPCGECVKMLLNHRLDKYDYPFLALAVSDVLSNRFHKAQPIDHSGSLDLTSQGDHNEGDTLGFCSFAKFLGGVARGVQKSTNHGVFGEFPRCPYALACSSFLTLTETVLSGLHQTNNEECPFWLYLLSHGIQGLTENISNTLEIDDASVARIKDKACAVSETYNSIPHHQLNLKPKDLCLIPFRVAIAAQEDGWWVRSVIIWSKLNPMPESVNGWRWEKHRIKVKSQDYSEYKQPGKISNGEVSGGHRNRDAIGGVWQGGAEWIECPGCSKCLSNDGYVLIKGSWRPTSSYEYILMLTKTDSYFCDIDAVREKNTWDVGPQRFAKETTRKEFDNTMAGGGSKIKGHSGGWTQNGEPITNPNGRNLRDVWTFPTTPFPTAHFAVFPEKLPETCIKAATSEKGCCPKCGAPWARVVERTGHINKREPAHVPNNTQTKVDSTGWAPTTRETDKWKPSCNCGEVQPIPCTVLDPFMGSGTTLKVSTNLGRKSIGYDISERYCEMAMERCKRLV